MLLSPERAVVPASSGLRLSKSKFLSGLQCHKRLYLEIHAPELATPPDAATQAVLDMGTEVGELARRRFPGGVLVDAGHRQSAAALAQTQELIGGTPVPALFEAAFSFEQVLVRVDILERMTTPDGGEAWRIIEVKSSTRVKEIHVEDLAVQTHVLRGAGLRIDAACLLHINSHYVYDGGRLDLQQFFALQDLTAPVMAKQPSVMARLHDMRRVLLAPTAPSIEPGVQCQTPYECPFWRHCTKDKPARWIFHLPGGGYTYQSLAKLGVQTIDEIPDGFSLSIVQRRMKDNVEWISPKLRGVLETVRYPVHHLDFETFMPAIPRFAATRPYQTIPTQWSNHVETADGQVRHDEYLCAHPLDPREELIASLLDSLRGEGSICVYSGYEQTILERLSDAYPKYKADLQEVIRRLWDLFPIIQAHYYHPAFGGSYSIKAVLPAVVPSLGYKDLEIQDGGMAARAYERMVFGETDLIEKIALREALLLYCARDTLAMLELRRALYRRCLEGPRSAAAIIG